MKKLERILLVDDDPDTNFYNEYILNQLNAADHIIAFQSAKEALQYLVEKNENVDLILLDINMPVMSGWQFLEHFNKLDKKRRSAILTVMLTASLNSDDQKKAASFPSIKKFIHKPLNKQTILEILALFE